MRKPHLVLVLSLFVLPACAQTGPEIANAGYAWPASIPVTPGQIITLFVKGLNASPRNASALPLPTNLNGVSVSVKEQYSNYPRLLPIFEIRKGLCGGGLPVQCGITGITVQIPTEPYCVPQFNGCQGPFFLTLSVTENGVTGDQFTFLLGGGNLHVVNTCDTISTIPSETGFCEPVITHANGARANWNHAAVPGEELVIYAVGLGVFGGTVKSGEPAPNPAPPAILDAFRMNFEFRVGAQPSAPLNMDQAPKPLYVGLVPGFVGLYQINFQLPDQFPSTTPACGTAGIVPVPGWVTVSVAGSGLDGGQIAICQPRLQ